jgi:Tat protein secretion system quality control protein TatD with DNase activity
LTHPRCRKKYGIDGQKENELEGNFDLERYRKLTRSKKVVAIGEMGLDYYHRPKSQNKKKTPTCMI